MAEPATLLVADDDPGLRESLERTLTFSVRALPTRSISPSWSTRRSFGWRSSGSSPISSRKSVPPFASSKRPIFRPTAPVNAPRSWPKRSLSMSDAGMAAQFTLTSTASFRRLRAWMAWAISSLPVPVSPVTSTVESVGATCSTLLSTRRSAGDPPTGSFGPTASCTSSRRYRVKLSRRWRSASARPRSTISRRITV